MKRFLAWVGVSAALVIAFLVALWRGRKQGEDIGEAKGRAETDRERLREAEASGDEERVLDEWRRHR